MITVRQVPSHRGGDITQLAFTAAEAAVMLGFCKEDSDDNTRAAANRKVRRLIISGALRARHTGAAYIIPGAALAEYLDGRDNPIKHPDSA